MSSSKELRVIVDADECLGYAICTLDAPSIFEMDDEADVARVIVDLVPADQKALVDAAIKSCPVNAIKWSSPDE